MRTQTVSLAVLLLGVVAEGLAVPIQLVRDQGTTFAIYRDRTAPPSVVMAATELQEYAYQVSGAKLAIVHEPATPMICLGDNGASRAAGLSVKTVPADGFRIVTTDGNVFILGPDTMEGELTPGGGTSTGTRNGTYAFIERFLGVRWLMPGEHGDYVPKSPNITIPETDVTETPAFLNRRLPYTQQHRSDVKRWWARQRLGSSLYLTHGHNWRRTIPASHFDEHPDWFPERGGVRVPPTGRYKLCTTNPGLVGAYGDAIIAYFNRHPKATCYSLSPSDSAGYCECERCSALYETDPNGDRSVTPAILTFYNDVARRVASKHPKKLLAGYVYAAYVFPPKKPIRLEPNVFLVWAPSFDYGFTLFRPALRKQWERLLSQWTQVTRNISYYDLPVNIQTDAGALNPPGLKILAFLYPRLKSGGVKGVYVYGIEAWGRAAPLNYLLAKLAWNPQADVEALFNEYCAKAYGKGGDAVNRMFRLLDAEVERHFLEYPNARYHLTPDMMRDVYAKNLPEIGRLYRAAEAAVRDSDARARLKMIGDNLTVLFWNLRQHRMLEDPQASSFHLSDAEFFKFLSRNKRSLALKPTAATSPPSYVRKKLTVTPADDVPNAEPVKPHRLRGNQHLVLCPVGSRPVEVKFRRIATRGKLITYSVYRPDGTEITSGLMSGEVPVKLDAGGSRYYHVAISAGSASFMVEVAGAAWAVDACLSDQGLHLQGSVTPVYFRAPKGQSVFHLSLEATPPGETAVATLREPNGQAIAEFDCTSLSVDRKKIDVAAGSDGWWKLEIKQAPTGALDDVWVQTGEELSGYLSVTPGQALDVTVGK